MKHTNDNRIDSLFEEALRRNEQGENLKDYFDAHAEIEQEARALFAIEKRISALASSVDVPKAGLERALREALPIEHAAPVLSPFSPAKRLAMIFQFGVPVAAFAVILLMVVTTATPPSDGPGVATDFEINSAQMRSFEASSDASGGVEGTSMMMSAKQAPLPEPTGSVDDLRAALIAGAEADREALSGDDQDFAYATADDGTLTSLIQTYDETNL
jgi:hypothetical protein